MSAERFIGKKVKVVSRDGSNVIIWYGRVLSVDSRFLDLEDKFGKEVSLSLEKIDKIEEANL